MDSTPCRCGHVAEAHEHYRAGTDCGACGCPRFRPLGVRTGPDTASLRLRLRAAVRRLAGPGS